MYTIRSLMMEDIDQVCALEEMVFSMPWQRDAFIEMVENKDALYLVVEEKSNPGVVIAACGLRHIVGEGDISNVLVHPNHRKRGIARLMIGELLKAGREKYGIEAYTLEVRKSNEDAIHLYQYHGFVEEGIRKNFYEKPTEDAIIMWKR